MSEPPRLILPQAALRAAADALARELERNSVVDTILATKAMFSAILPVATVTIVERNPAPVQPARGDYLRGRKRKPKEGASEPAFTPPAPHPAAHLVEAVISSEKATTAA